MHGNASLQSDVAMPLVTPRLGLICDGGLCCNLSCSALCWAALPSIC